MNTRKVGLAGFGTIGRPVGKALDDGIDGLELVAVCVRDRARAESRMAEFRNPVPIVSPEELAEAADIVVEIVPKAAFASIALPALKAGRLLVTVSGAGLLEHPEVIELARSGAGRIQLATGALLGLDAVRAAAEGTIEAGSPGPSGAPRPRNRARRRLKRPRNFACRNNTTAIIPGGDLRGASAQMALIWRSAGPRQPAAALSLGPPAPAPSTSAQIFWAHTP